MSVKVEFFVFGSSESSVLIIHTNYFAKLRVLDNAYYPSGGGDGSLNATQRLFRTRIKRRGEQHRMRQSATVQERAVFKNVCPLSPCAGFCGSSRYAYLLLLCRGVPLCAPHHWFEGVRVGHPTLPTLLPKGNGVCQMFGRLILANI